MEKERLILIDDCVQRATHEIQWAGGKLHMSISSRLLSIREDIVLMIIKCRPYVEYILRPRAVSQFPM
jgi:hypothetical protein